ncbi:hypothetical protein BaRGS_00020484, partial [Batillaria attramentaria]
MREEESSHPTATGGFSQRTLDRQRPEVAYAAPSNLKGREIMHGIGASNLH